MEERGRSQGLGIQAKETEQDEREIKEYILEMSIDIYGLTHGT